MCMGTNVLKTFPYEPKYYLTHPWKWFQQLGHNLQCAWSRITKGYCDYDWYDLDYWFYDVFPEMLDKLATRGIAYPDSFESLEAWHGWLHKQATELRKTEPNYVAASILKPAPEYTIVNDDLECTDADTSDVYYAALIQAWDDANIRFQNTMKEICKYFRFLWD